MKSIYALAAIFVAVASHRCVDFLISGGLVHATDTGYRHIAVAPAAVAALAMLAALASFAYNDRKRWFERLVREIEAAPLAKAGFAIFAFACMTLFAIESIEQMLSLGHLDGPTSWLGTAAPVALAIIALISFVIARCVQRGARTLLDALHSIRAIVEMPIALRSRAGRVFSFDRVYALAPASYATVAPRVRGLRAPPRSN